MAPIIDPNLIAGLTADSRAVQPGFLFAALPGTARDGRAFIEDALLKGATYILAQTGTTLPQGSTAILLETPDPRRDLALLAAAFYAPQPSTIVAVTGTNGKTSVAHFTRQIWDYLGHKAGYIGTLGVHAPGLTRDDGLTTPDSVALHTDLQALARLGIGHVALEASSHGLHQRRLDGIALAAAAFTNLTRDHLDYHGTMEAYFAAKARLFDLLPPDKPAVLWVDDPYVNRLSDSIKNPCLTVGHTGQHIRLLSQTPLAQGQDIDVQAQGHIHRVHLPLIGLFQAANILMAAGLVMASTPSVSFGDLIPALLKLTGVPGRLQPVPGHKRGAGVYVDYAHTPDGLETVLKAVRPHVRGALWVVFGAGGDRDPGKRPLMGRAAAQFADRVVVTDDNPRSENPGTIRQAILTGCPEAVESGDRRSAIAMAVAALGPDDGLVIAGKGHEQGQKIGGVVHPFDDVRVALAAMQEGF